MTISLRLNDQDAQLIKNYAQLNGLSVSELIRESVLERIENEYDLRAYDLAMSEFEEDLITYSLDQVERELGLQ